MTDVYAIADSVTDWLNGLALGFTAVRSYRTVTELGELETLHVSVIPRPNGYKETILARNGAKKIEHIIDIAMQKKTTSDFEIDGYVKKCHAIATAAGLHLFSNVLCVRAQYDPSFSPEHIEQLRQFFGLVTLHLVELS